MLKVYKNLFFSVLIVTFLITVYVKYNNFEASSNTQQPNDITAISKKLFPNSGATSEYQSSANTFTVDFSTQTEEDETKLKTVIQFRNLIKKLAHCHDNCGNINKQETSHLPQNIVTDPTFLRMVKRVKKYKEVCTDDNPELKAEFCQSSNYPIIRDDVHHLSICTSPKSGSSTMALYGQVLNIYNDITSKIEHLLSKRIRTKLTHGSDLNTLQNQRSGWTDSNINVHVVRHPFQRLVSAYNYVLYHMKVSSRKISTKMRQSMLSLSLVPYSETTKLLGIPKDKLKCSHNLNGTVGELKTTINTNGQKVPSFRGFVLGLIDYKKHGNGKLDCLKNGQRYMMSQVRRCAPCSMNYDAILKLETLNEDRSLIERVLGIESAWKLQQQIVKNRMKKDIESSAEIGNLGTNVQEKPYPYIDYMNQLASHEMDLLFEVYANDFNVYGYDPCLDINSASQA